MPSKRICASSGTATTPTPVVRSFAAFCCEKYMDFAPHIGRVKSFDGSSLVLECLMVLTLVPGYFGNTVIK